ncbi:prominin-like protein isoform X1 [Drosophila obscura]|uniref:prominin-like protein isoform X1 n=1 Tax=Drosophila obscura TaxID=7282 RepID=UPI001BB1A231|nr:prominin-like protein isoform X1 [Drosophila obscura]
MALTEPPRYRRSTGKGRKRHFGPRAVRGIHAVKLILVLLSLIPIIVQEAAGQKPEGGEGGNRTYRKGGDDIVWREGYMGDGTTHEQLGQRHWGYTEYSAYHGYANYSRDLTSTHKALNPIYSILHLILRKLMSDLPPGYVMLTSNNKLVLGPKVMQNDWAALLGKYWVLLLVVTFLLACIIVIPFIGVCYCCFCCCLRCKQHSKSKKRPGRMCYSVCLALLIIGLIFGLIVAFIANKFLDRGFEDAKLTMRRGSEDTCSFLKDVSDHIYHLMVYNYQELEAHLEEQLSDAHNHIFLDLGDTSESTALAEMERIFVNMPKALNLMVQVDALEKELRFLASQLRDSLRGVKRLLNYCGYALCHLTRCYRFHHEINLQDFGNAPCLHIDWMPNTTVYVEAIKEIIDEEYYQLPLRAMARLNTIKEMIHKQLRLVLPPMFRGIHRGRVMMLDEATQVRDMIDAMISDIHLNTLRTTRAFEDVYVKFGDERRAINIVICVLIFIIIVILTSALICGSFGRRRTMPGPSKVFSKGMAASCLLVAIILIFCVFSFLTLVGLFYLMIGLITYSTACAPLKDEHAQNIFKQLDPVIDLNRFMSLNNGERDSLPKMSVSNAIRACHVNESIFDLLRANKKYDINNLLSMEIFLDEAEKTPVFSKDLSKIYLFLEEEKRSLNNMREANLSTYHSSLYVDKLCTKYGPNDIGVLGREIRDMAIRLNTRWSYDYPRAVCYYVGYIDMNMYNLEMEVPLNVIVKKLRRKVKDIDKLILYDNNNFNNGFKILMDAVQRSEDFIRTKGEDYINHLALNFTISINEQFQDYIERVIWEGNNNVGHCQPLAYIYHQGVNLLCARLVYPINAFWLAILLCSLLLLPILLVAHRLMCMYLKIYPSPIVAQLAAVEAARCPVCIGPPVRSVWKYNNRGRAGRTSPEELDRPIQVLAIRDESTTNSKQLHELKTEKANNKDQKTSQIGEQYENGVVAAAARGA